jgi:hypothetical protein
VLYDVINGTGGEANTGDVVFVQATSTGVTVTAPTAIGSVLNGVWFGRTANNERGTVIVKGFAPVKVAAGGSAGARITASGTARVGRAVDGFYAGNLGRLVQLAPLNANLAMGLIDGDMSNMRTGEELIYRTLISGTTLTITDLPTRYTQYRVEYRLRSSTASTTDTVTVALGSNNTINTTITNYSSLIVSMAAPTGAGTPTFSSNGNNGLVAGVQFSVSANTSPAECVGAGELKIITTGDGGALVSITGQNSYRTGANTSALALINQQIAGNWRDALGSAFNCLRFSAPGTLTGYIAIYGTGVPFA